MMIVAVCAAWHLLWSSVLGKLTDGVALQPPQQGATRMAQDRYLHAFTNLMKSIKEESQ